MERFVVIGDKHNNELKEILLEEFQLETIKIQEFVPLLILSDDYADKGVCRIFNLKKISKKPKLEDQISPKLEELPNSQELP